MIRILSLLLLTALVAFPCPRRAYADTFGAGPDSFDIEFVTVGNPANPPDTTGQPNPAGSVPYEYRIGKFEISEQMIDKANALGSLGITKDSRGPDKPATSVDWFEAARFVNWLNTSTGHSPAYKFVEVPGRPPTFAFALWVPTDAGYNPSNGFRNSLATYVLPSADEWYKAAFYNSSAQTYFDYPTGSNSPPTPVASGISPGTAILQQMESTGPADIMQAGGLSPYGTMAQAGNINEWEESAVDLLNNDPMEVRGARGAAWGAFTSSASSSNRFGNFPNVGLGAGGFRVASVVPEPSCLGLSLLGLFRIAFARRRYVISGRIRRD